MRQPWNTPAGSGGPAAVPGGPASASTRLLRGMCEGAHSQDAGASPDMLPAANRAGANKN